MTIQKKGRFFSLHDERGELVCITVYRKGAVEVIRRLKTAGETQTMQGDFLKTSFPGLTPAMLARGPKWQ